MKREYRLSNSKTFNYLYKRGKQAFTRQFILIYSESKYPTLKVGVVASKKVGKAVVRNSVRRHLREAMGSLIPQIKNQYNIVIVAKPSIVELSHQELIAALHKCLLKNGLFKEEQDS